jgi:peptide/nickel transport system ATP-binding protein
MDAEVSPVTALGQTPVLEVEDLAVTFTRKGEQSTRAVDGVSFAVAPGETIGLVGESGCGKSVTSLAIMGLLPKRAVEVSGSVRFGGEELLGKDDRALRKLRGADMAMVFQDPLSSLNPVMTVGFQVAEAIMLHQQVSRREAWDRAVQMLHRVGIPDTEIRAHSYPHQVSGGQRQRVMIAMAFACNPEVVIADEPTTALDVTVQRQVLDLMLELRRERQTSIMLITHDLGVVAETADRVMVMYAGRVVETGTVYEIFDEPRHPYTQGLLASVPRLEAERQEHLPMVAGQPPDLLTIPEGCAFRPRCSAAGEECVRVPEWLELSPTHRVRCWAAER